MTTFIAIDFETANPNFSSICQVGIAIFKNGMFYDSWESLVNPDDYFDPLNISIHGIDEWTVRNAPKWGEVYGQFNLWLKNNIVVSHTLFDQTALLLACEKNDINVFDCAWLDTSRVVRRAWPQFAYKGYGLANIASFLNIEFNHHDAKEDARACGEILLKAIQLSGLTIDGWLERARQPLSPLTLAGNSEGPLYGENLVFTGALSIPRREAAALAAVIGCKVEQNVTKHTTMLVVGDQDILKLAGYDKSIKHRKAEQLIANGNNIKIIGESDFKKLVKTHEISLS
jgi:DNA polymerase-3 subunit epsilon